MALTSELLKTVNGLTDEQISTLLILSKNDEEKVLGQKIGELHGQYDQDIKSVLGIDKPQGKKTYAWLKEDILPQVKETESLKSQLETLKTEKASLEKQLQDGLKDGDLKQKLTDANSQIDALKGQLEETETTWKAKVEEAQNSIVQMRIDQEFSSALTGLKFKDEKLIPAEVRETYISSAKQNILNEVATDWIDDGKGGKTLVFRDQKGEIMRNKDNALNPYTPAELLSQKLKPILDQGRQQNGTGTGAGKPGGGGSAATLDFSGVKSRTQATPIINEYLAAQGITKTDPRHRTEAQKIMEENGLHELPLQ